MEMGEHFHEMTGKGQVSDCYHKHCGSGDKLETIRLWHHNTTAIVHTFIYYGIYQHERRGRKGDR